ncbi:MAG TPA: class I adenylate-forming enzyme family protein [Vicinamibacterales bacterium]|nr:class I adenylate-forming enzyme family protein [Vicinamibacterales bacterium]
MPLIVDAVRRAAETTPDRPALIVGDRRVTYRELDGWSTAAAAQLRDAGVGRRECVALHLTNGVEIVVGYLACFKRGAVALPINTRFRTHEIDYVLRHARAAAYVGHRDLAREIAEWPDHVRVRYIDGEFLATAERAGLPSDTTGARDSHGAEVSDDDPAAVLYTSGTTARPKGVTHTQRTLAALAESGAALLGDITGTVFIPLPMVHMAALLGLAASLRQSLTIATAPVFEPHAFLDEFERQRGTAMTGMPVLYRVLVEAQRQRRRDVSSGHMFAVGGDSVPTALQQEFTALFGRPLCEAYGLSEIVPVSMNMEDAMRVGSLGRPSPGVRVRICDAAGGDVARGEIGELCVQAPGVFVGYWNNPDATQQSFRDGWFLTGDLAHEDADGFYWFDGRKKEIIVRGGSNIAPQEVEEAIYQHPAVAEVAVVGAPDKQWGEIVIAGVALRAGQTVREDELIAFVRERLSLYKCPERVLFMPALPKGPTGKVLRRAVKESLAYL